MVRYTVAAVLILGIAPCWIQHRGLQRHRNPVDQFSELDNPAATEKTSRRGVAECVSSHCWHLGGIRALKIGSRGVESCATHGKQTGGRFKGENSVVSGVGQAQNSDEFKLYVVLQYLTIRQV